MPGIHSRPMVSPAMPAAWLGLSCLLSLASLTCRPAEAAPLWSMGAVPHHITAQASEQAQGRPAPARQATSRKRSSRSVRVQQLPSSSEESEAQRSQRLQRECQGRPNAGACLGYAQPPQRRQR